MQEMWVQSLGWKDPLEKERTTHSSILAWKIPWTEEPGELQSTGVAKESDTIQRLSMHMRTHTLTDVPLNLMVSSPQLYTYFSFFHLVNTLYTLIFLGK